MAQQVADSQFASTAAGHEFELRPILSKVDARRCARCHADVFAHARHEVPAARLLAALDVADDAKLSPIVPRALLLGSYRAMAAHLARDETAVAVNCAGTQLHSFLPKTRPAADLLRQAGRLYDLEWQDAEHFQLEQACTRPHPPLPCVCSQAEVLAAIAWANEHLAQSRCVVVNCAQGKSRSGAFAVLLLMHNRDVSASEALLFIQSRRPLVEPNPGFMVQLHKLEPAIRAAGRSVKCLPQALAVGFEDT
ncbi:hypothetical protein AB1Y20_016101 [Prymnesium parvum]|uniref:Tyrosine specific protein phosphatases domain-containing protein n=1 Tax=Prymnesium parvum TaxID=97485 RepID=A0AB34K0F0_PRYPA